MSGIKRNAIPLCLFCLLLLPFTHCGQTTIDSEEGEALIKIAFGSCNHQNEPQPLWSPILENNPDLWIWLGDNIYADTHDMTVMQSKYQEQKSNSGYQQLIAQCPVIGIWDDHDYGTNDGGKEYRPKAESQQLLLDFLDVPKDDLRRQREGAYSLSAYGPEGKRITVILLDGRYFKDLLFKNDGAYLPNPQADILGEEQWQWFESEFSKSNADLHIIGCGIQFLPSQHRFEKWANFPTAKARLIDLLEAHPDKKTVLLSGDRHIGEISHQSSEILNYPLYEITSSGLTHAYTGNTSEPNDLRVGKIVNRLNFGLIQINWDKFEITYDLRGVGNEILETQTVSYE